MSSKFSTIAALCLTYIVFAILLNSVGTVILQVINTYDISKTAASSLEGFKDLPIAIVSFFVASSLPRLGYRRAMIIALALVGGMSAIMPLFPDFIMNKLLFLVTGIAFALVKVAIYSSIGLITKNNQEHASLLNFIEGMFMVGVVGGYWLFSFFIDPLNPTSTYWLDVYYYVAALSFIAMLLWCFTPLHQPDATAKHEQTLGKDFLDMLALVKRPLVYIFVVSVFLYVLIEQGIGTWLPTFNNKILQLPLDMSVQAASIFAICLAAGRLGAGLILRYMSWYTLLNISLVMVISLIIVSLPLAQNIESSEDTHWLNAPLAAYVFPLIGLFMAPIYPAINSAVLSSLEKSKHASMTGLIIVFSALGGTTGSLVTGAAFEMLGGRQAFYLTIIPAVAIIIALFFFKRHIGTSAGETTLS